MSRLCACGCGGEVSIAKTTNPTRGHRRGEPVRYLVGHGNAWKQATRSLRELYTVDDLTGCWAWNGSTSNTGYGTISRGAFRGLAHRYFFQEFRDAIPDGWQIDHLCRNRACVNPAHLEAVPQAVNRQRIEMVSDLFAHRIRMTLMRTPGHDPRLELS